MKREVVVSVSEINQYLKCRRAWNLTSNSGRSLRHKVTPKIYFVVGSGVHEAIEANAMGKDPMEALERFIDKERAERIAYYEEQVGSSPWKAELEDFEESAELARNLATQYFKKYGLDNPLESEGLKYLAVEVPFAIPLGIETDEVTVTLVGTFDGVATDIETESQFFLVENKTATQKPNPERIQTGNQFVGYNWVFRELTGVTPSGTLYNGMLKRLIEPPKVLKSGELSQNKSASVTLGSFMEMVNRGGYDPEKYFDYIEFLANRENAGDHRFFYREMFYYPESQLDNWGATLYQVVNEMIQPGLAIYPNFTSCDFCTVTDICHAMEYNRDVEAVIEAGYKTGTYGTMEAVTNSPSFNYAGSTGELVEHFRTFLTKESD